MVGQESLVVGLRCLLPHEARFHFRIGLKRCLPQERRKNLSIQPPASKPRVDAQ